jgi:nucleoside-diphosphate-sugar epimerase
MKPKVLFIGGTGNVSAACSRLALEQGFDLHLLNRGTRPSGLPGASSIVANITDPISVANALGDLTFDVVVNFIAFDVQDVQRDIDLFKGRCEQYVFVSSASCYTKPWFRPITEDVPLANPAWDYSRKKIACEELLALEANKGAAPKFTIVRPSLTYDTVLPVPLGGWAEWTVAARLLAGKPAVVHGDGLSPWTVTHSEDLARGLVGLLGNPGAYGEAFHITGDEVQTWDEIYTKLADSLGVEARLVHVASETIAAVMPDRAGSLLGDKAHALIFDNTKLKTLVPSFRQEILFAEGIKRSVNWFLADEARRVFSASVDAQMDRLVNLQATAK